MSFTFFLNEYNPASNMKYRSVSSWVAGPLKMWDGVAWRKATLKRWDGSNWVIV